MLGTVKMAFINQMEQTGMLDLYDLSVTTEVAANMVGDIAEEIEKTKMLER